VRGKSIPLADFGAFRRRAVVLRSTRLLIVLALAATLILALLAALHQRTARTTLLPRSANGIVVLDVSASISSDTYARIATTLRRLVRAGGEYGLVLFSDTAYQALPPQTPARELAPFVRFFDVGERTGPGALPQPPDSPWAASFSGGTRISTGLSAALEVIREQRLARPAVLLVSDLDDDTGDLERVTQLALAYRRAGIPLHVVGLDPAPEDLAFIRRLAPTGGFTQATLPGERAQDVSQAGVDTRLVLAAVLAALLLAALLATTERLRWRSA
jgi:Mg-chelatase subunit ChlD